MSLVSRPHGRLNSIIDPGQNSALPTQPLAGIKLLTVDKIKYIFIVLVLPTKSVFKH
jgi:hypothetical protein